MVPTFRSRSPYASAAISGTYTFTLDRTNLTATDGAQLDSTHGDGAFTGQPVAKIACSPFKVPVP